MGKKFSKSFSEQENAIEKGEISFNLNIYFVGEEISIIYERFVSDKSNGKSGLLSYWNYIYQKGNYNEQLNAIAQLFKEKKDKFKKNSIINKFNEVIIVKMKEKDDEKIEKIFDTFASEDKDVYCPFIIFFFDNMNNETDKVIPDQETYYISPFKVFTYKFDTFTSESINNFYKELYRICSYYNELGDQIIVWPKEGEEPLIYDLINAKFNSYINIFCLGKTGSGKSTFLNKFFGEKRSKQGGTGRSTTSKIVRFGIDQIPIRLFDIPGFEGNETIEKVKKKLIQTADEMNSDKDRIHLILYFINNKEETLFYEMENEIIETLKKNNKDVRILFIMTHSELNPYDLVKIKKQNKKVGLLKANIDKAINNISSIFGEHYSYNNGYFQKDSLIQQNLIFVNLEKDYANDKEEFGFDKVIKRIYETIVEGNDFSNLNKVKNMLSNAIINHIKKDEALDKKIEECLSQGYLLQQTTFATQKEKVLIEAQKLYDDMFSVGKTLLTISPFVRDVKLGVIKYQKYKFKKNLNRIFGFNIKDKNFDDFYEDETKYEKMNREYLEKQEDSKDKLNKENLIKEIRKDYHEKEVSSTWIVANEVAGYVSYMFLFGGPVMMVIGGAGLVGTSYISYKQFKTDCTEYFNQYKNHYEEYKYYSLYNFINCILLGIEYFENYVISLDNQAAPSVNNILENVKKNIEHDLKTAEGGNNTQNQKEIMSNIPFFN